MEKKNTNILDQLKGLFKKDKLEDELKKSLAEVEANPQDLRLKIRLGELYFKRRELQKGIETFRQVAEGYVEEGFFLKAVAIYKNMIRMAPGSIEYNEKLAHLYQQLGMSKDAINQYLILINYYQNHQQKEKALQAAQAMVSVDPTDFQSRMRLAEIYYHCGQQDEALREYEKLGSELKEQGGKQLDLLIDVLDNIFFRRPKDMSLLKEICILHLKNRHPESAVKKIEKYRLAEEGDFKKIYDKAQEMIQHELHKKEALQPSKEEAAS
ncbi:MAG: bacterial transcriptional activator domain-containing protein [Deltaproteobacteria bacterium]|nr:bacterial transcriptional activator domain-containing protein [Deltaproteobacteria bacterium]